MGPIEEALRLHFLPALMGGPVSEELRVLMAHSVKRGGLGIPNPTVVADHSYATSAACCKELVQSLLHKSTLNYKAYK
eukprot:11996682-Ditylum_brightwellii.AAC.1